LIRSALFIALVACGGRTELDGRTSEGAPDAAAPSDVSIEHPRTCDPNAPFTSISPLPFNTDRDEYDVRLTPDELTLYFVQQRVDQSLGYESDVFSARRSSITSPFSSPVLLPGLADPNSSAEVPNPTADNLDLVFEGACSDIFVHHARLCGAHRTTPDGLFQEISMITVEPTLDTYGGSAYTIHDGSRLYFVEEPLDTFARADRIDATTYGGLEKLTLQGVSGIAYAPVVSEDETELFFDIYSGGDSDSIFVATSDGSPAFSNVHVVAGLPPNSYPNWISPDGCRLYFTHREPTDAWFEEDVFVAER